jgi:hypothetical protein
VVSDHITKSSPNAVVFVLAIASPLSNEKVFRFDAT